MLVAVAGLSAFGLGDGPRPWARRRWSPGGPSRRRPSASWAPAIDFQVPEPNTWRETLALLDARLPVAGLRVAVQEYGKPVPELTEGLEQRGAVVTRVPVYRWALPEDTGPLRAALTAIAERRIGAALFTAAQQVEHVLQVAADAGIEDDLRAALARARRRRLDRADDLGRPPRARPAGRHRAGAPQVGPSRRRGRGVLANRSKGRIAVNCGRQRVPV